LEKGGHALAAALGAITPDALLGPAAKGKTWRELYDQLNAGQDAEDAAFAKEHPVAEGLSQVAGGIALPIAPELKAAEGAGTLAKLGTGAANAALRVGSNTAISAADAAARGHDPVEAAKRAALVGGGLEVVGAGARGLSSLGEAGGATMDAAGDVAKGLAEEKAFKAAVGNQAKAYNEAADRGVINERGRELLDEGVVGFGDSAAQIAAKAKVAGKEAGKGIGDLLDSIDKAAPTPMVNGKSMADELRAYANEIGGSGNKPLVTRLTEAADDLEARGNMTFAQAQTEKNSWAWEPGSAVTKVAARRVKGIIGQEMEDAIGRLGQVPEGTASAAIAEAPSQFGEMLQTGSGRPRMQSQPHAAIYKDAELAPDSALSPDQQQALYQQLKSKYGTMTAAAKDAQVNANRYDKNNSFSVGDKAAAFGAAALTPHGAAAKVATGMLAGAANKFVRKRGNSAAAVGLDKIGDVLKATPEVFGKYAAPLLESLGRGEQSLAVTHYLLMQQDPDYQNLVGGKGEDVP
jgi:hypothetical protein